jgi:TolA-binding protein
LFAQAQNAFLKNELSEAIPYYEKTSIDHLTNIEITDEKFEMAYAYLITKQFDKAEPLFRSIKELQQGKYYKAGNYYYGLLAYNQHNLTEALKCFELIKNDPAYKAVVPYYIAEIHYFSGQKDTCLKVAQAIVAQKDKSFYDNE